MQYVPAPQSWKVALAVVVVTVFAILSARAEEMRTIDGQIFIRTKGAETFKLSLVEVQLFDEKTIASHLSKKRKIVVQLSAELEPLLNEARVARTHAGEIKEAAWDAFKQAFANADLKERNRLAADALLKAVQRLSALSGASTYMISASYYFQGLPAPLQATKTDADGKFTFQVKSGTYVLAAVSSRNAGVDVIGTSSIPRVEFYSWLVKVVLTENKKVMLANDNLSSGDSSDSLIVTPDSESELSNFKDITDVANVIAQEKQARTAAEEEKKQAAEAAQQEAARKDEAVKKEVAAKAQKEREAEIAVYRNNPKAAQQKAIELFPDVGVASSALNKEFVERMKRYQSGKKEFFAEPDWPVRLAKECSEALATKVVPK